MIQADDETESNKITRDRYSFKKKKRKKELLLFFETISVMLCRIIIIFLRTTFNRTNFGLRQILDTKANERFFVDVVNYYMISIGDKFIVDIS